MLNNTTVMYTLICWIILQYMYTLICWIILQYMYTLICWIILQYMYTLICWIILQYMYTLICWIILQYMYTLIICWIILQYMYALICIHHQFLVQWISVALKNSMEVVSCPDNKQYMLLILSRHETPSTEFFNATEIHCSPVPIIRIAWDQNCLHNLYTIEHPMACLA